jgi:hypothetical protein
MMFSVSNPPSPSSLGSARRDLVLWLPFVLVRLALVYLAIGLMVDACHDLNRVTVLSIWPGLLLPLRLFVLGIAPAGAVYALMWAERALGDPCTRRLVRTVAILGAGVAVMTLAGRFPS